MLGVADLDVLGTHAKRLPDGNGQAVLAAGVYDAIQPVTAAGLQLDAQQANWAARPKEFCGPIKPMLSSQLLAWPSRRMWVKLAHTIAQ